ERDKILTVIGKTNGKFTMLAKGIRKLESKNRGSIQTLSLSNISYYQAEGMPLLIESESIFTSDFTKINIKNIERCLILINKLLPDNEPYEKIFNALESVIEHNFDNASINRFRLIFLIEEGLINDLNICSICQEKTPKYLDTNTVDFLCEDCSKISKNKVIKLDKTIYSNDDFSLILDKYINKLLKEIA
ncbi:MAG TPA: DNA repair protein RecO, partial [Candidatus Dojkabacteria bacterium]|nr:DNA repair protein RecO [Candidatus Dojkabacteria bacterium]